MTGYFREWFPGYIYRTDDATAAFWSTWWVRMAVAGGGAIALGIVQWTTMRRGVRSPTPVA
jgi:hypothetical protein